MNRPRPETAAEQQARWDKSAEFQAHQATTEATTVTEDARLGSTGDPGLDTELKRRRDTMAAIRKVGEVGTAVGETTLSLGAGDVEDATILATGKDIHGREQSRGIAALGMAVPFVSGKALRMAAQAARHADEAGEVGQQALRHGDDLPLAFDARRGKLRAGFVHDDYVRWVRGPGAKQAKFETPWSADRGLGTRNFDDYDPRTLTGFEGNTTPWSQMTQQQVSRKLDQAASDFTLMQTDPNVSRVVWFGTEELPTTGLGGQLRRALSASGIEYWVVRP